MMKKSNTNQFHQLLISNTWNPEPNFNNAPMNYIWVNPNNPNDKIEVYASTLQLAKGVIDWYFTVFCNLPSVRLQDILPIENNYFQSLSSKDTMNKYSLQKGIYQSKTNSIKRDYTEHLQLIDASGFPTKPVYE